ncbi:hypothetical protein CTKZ_19210 [Cellulomonas algicola]|uniref:Uncharacterized protein n=1 Tax=Cellulomonas algicola TaxID=2071633 RepID=A0A401V091_9CELL|nr:hypothetical protein CTKZ_19210 [Cellulomonas algicola]
MLAALGEKDLHLDRTRLDPGREVLDGHQRDRGDVAGRACGSGGHRAEADLEPHDDGDAEQTAFQPRLPEIAVHRVREPDEGRLTSLSVARGKVAN